MAAVIKIAGLHLSPPTICDAPQSRLRWPVGLTTATGCAFSITSPLAANDSAYGNDVDPENAADRVQQIGDLHCDASKVYDAQQAGHNVVSIQRGKTG